MDFNTVVSSGLSVGVPGTPALWDLAARDFGTRRLADLLATGRAAGPHGVHGRPDLPRPDRAERRPVRQVPRHRHGVPARRQAARGRVGVHEPGHGQGLRRAPPQGRQRPLPGRARRGRSSRRPAHRTPPTASASWVVRSPARDLADYSALKKAPVHSTYEGLDVYGMPVPSSGGIAVAEILNLMRDYELRTGIKTLRGRATSTTCTGSARPPRPRSPTATATSATFPACRSRS